MGLGAILEGNALERLMLGDCDSGGLNRHLVIIIVLRARDRRPGDAVPSKPCGGSD